jgi:hypothetical protein
LQLPVECSEFTNQLLAEFGESHAVALAFAQNGHGLAKVTIQGRNPQPRMAIAQW